MDERECVETRSKPQHLSLPQLQRWRHAACDFRRASVVDVTAAAAQDVVIPHPVVESYVILVYAQVLCNMYSYFDNFMYF